jgi:hypothetical protein
VIDEHQALPAELEARIAALESAASDQDFDALGWFWMVLFGIVLPAAWRSPPSCCAGVASTMRAGRGGYRRGASRRGANRNSRQAGHERQDAT